MVTPPHKKMLYFMYCDGFNILNDEIILTLDKAYHIANNKSNTMLLIVSFDKHTIIILTTIPWLKQLIVKEAYAP